MPSVKSELLAALAASLETLLPGAGKQAALESPKVAAHGDFASTAAMQLAKPLKSNPRQVAEQLRALLLAQAAFVQWVQDIDIAGPGFINMRLSAAAKQQVVQEILQTTAGFGKQATNGQRVLVEFVSANPTGPLHVGHGRQAALGDAICNLLQTQGWDVFREFYYNDAGVQINTLATSTQSRARGMRPGDAGWPTDPEDPASKAFYNGDYIADIAEDFKAGKTVVSDDRQFTASGNIEDLDNIREFAVAYLRREQDLDLKAFALHFDNYYLESSLYSSGRVAATVEKLKAAGKTALDVALEIVSRSTQQKLCITNFSHLIDYIDYGDDFLNGTAFRYIDEYLKTGEKTVQVIVAGDKYGYTFNQLLGFRDAGKTGRDIANEVLDRELGQRDGVSKLGQRDGVSETGH